MKNPTTLFPLIALSAFLTLFSCEKNTDIDFEDVPLHGDWVRSSTRTDLDWDGTFDYTEKDLMGSRGYYFGSDQTWTSKIHNGLELTGAHEGTWELEGDFILREVEASLFNGRQPISPAIRDTLKLVSVNNESLVLGFMIQGKVIQEEIYDRQK